MQELWIKEAVSRAAAAKIANEVWSAALTEGPLEDTYRRAIEKVNSYQNRAVKDLMPEQRQTLARIKEVLRQHALFIE